MPKVTRTVRASRASTLFTSLYFSLCEHPPWGCVQYFQVNATSSAVRGVPSAHLRPLLSFQVMARKSFDTPPFSSVGTRSASQGVMFPFWS